MKILSSVSKVMALVGTALVLPMMVLIISDVFGRYFLNRPIKGTAEIASLMLVCMVFGVAWCAVQGRHIKVGLVVDRFSPRLQAIVDILTLIAGLCVSVIITWRSVVSALYVLEHKHVISATIQVPIHPFRWIFVLGWAVLCLVLASLLIQKVAEAVKR